MRKMATEAEAEAAWDDLRKIIEAAARKKNVENAAVIAAENPRLRRAMLEYAEVMSDAKR